MNYSTWFFKVKYFNTMTKDKEKKKKQASEEEISFSVMSFREVLGWHGRREWGLALLDAAVIAMAQAHLWTIFLQVEQLLAVERSSTLPGRKDGSKPTQCSKCSKIGSFYSIFTTLNPNFTGYTNLLSNELDSIFIFHPTFYQCERHQDRSSAGRENLLKT